MLQSLLRPMPRFLLLVLCLSVTSFAFSQQPTTVQSLNGTAFNADAYPGSDIGQKINAADSAMGSACGEISVNTAGTISSAFTLSPCHSLRFNASVSWQAANSILSGSQRVTCAAGTTLTSTSGGSMLSTQASGVSGIEAGDGCNITAPQGGTFLYIPKSASRVSVRNANLTGLIAVHACAEATSPSDTCTDMGLYDSSVSNTNYGMLGGGTKGLKAQRNRFTNVAVGAQYWGGDANPNSPGHVALANVGTSDIDFSNNTCYSVTTCTWGSEGITVLMKGNIAHGCGDVCFDAEGSAFITITDNYADGCAQGCFTTFFETRNALITNNIGNSTGSPIVLLKNASNDPNSVTDVLIQGNSMVCTAYCYAIAADPASIRIVENNIQNGSINTGWQNSQVAIQRNRLIETLAFPSGATAIYAGSLLYGNQAFISDNYVLSYVPQPSDTACITAIWGDYNSTDSYSITGNHCDGNASFPIDLQTTTAGGNVGTLALWTVADNWWGSNHEVHNFGQGNEVFKEFGKYVRTGGTWVYQFPQP